MIKQCIAYQLKALVWNDMQEEYYQNIFYSFFVAAILFFNAINVCLSEKQFSSLYAMSYCVCFSYMNVLKSSVYIDHFQNITVAKIC